MRDRLAQGKLCARDENQNFTRALTEAPLGRKYESILEYFENTFSGEKRDHVKLVAIEKVWSEITTLANEGQLPDNNLAEDIDVLRKSFDEELLHPIMKVRNLAAASDITRLVILYLYGGVYFDFDITVGIAGGDFTLEIPKPECDFLMGLFSERENRYVVSNQMLFSKRRGKFVREYLSVVAENYRNLNSDSPGTISIVEYDEDAVKNSKSVKRLEMQVLPIHKDLPDEKAMELYHEMDIISLSSSFPHKTEDRKIKLIEYLQGKINMLYAVCGEFAPKENPMSLFITKYSETIQKLQSGLWPSTKQSKMFGFDIDRFTLTLAVSGPVAMKKTVEKYYNGDCEQIRAETKFNGRSTDSKLWSGIMDTLNEIVEDGVSSN
ncbi:MAG: hypothetical protein KC505_09925 [Myxococcales bacterium]|nr:hypothetical protein [Myxococcales bacterium]USN50936.1 MAG: hypothetical protein H6731_00525 [Myxococcales bacterium]